MCVKRHSLQERNVLIVNRQVKKYIHLNSYKGFLKTQYQTKTKLKFNLLC